MSEKETEVRKEEKQKKPKKNRRAYLNDFQLQDDGGYVYKGTIYSYQGDWSEAQKNMRVLCAMLAVLAVIAGLIPSSGMMNTFYVILPYAAELTLSALLIYEALKLTMQDGNIREYIYKKTFEHIQGRFFLLFVTSAMCMVGEIVHLLFNWFMNHSLERIGFSLLFIAVQALIFGTVSGFNRQQQAMKFEKMKNS